MKKWPPINEALQGCLTPDEVAAGAVAYDVNHWKGAIPMADPMKQQYTCEKHGDIGAAVLAIMGYDRETGEIVDQFVGCVRCYVDFMRTNICTANPYPGKPEDGESTH